VGLAISYDAPGHNVSYQSKGLKFLQAVAIIKPEYLPFALALKAQVLRGHRAAYSQFFEPFVCLENVMLCASVRAHLGWVSLAGGWRELTCLSIPCAGTGFCVTCVHSGLHKCGSPTFLVSFLLGFCKHKCSCYDAE
jgi:hypothetical protein